MGAEDNVMLPLVWNGTTLSIPYASPVQDGYLSKHTFLFFSGGELVPVTSFNTRTGEVVLLEDDVLAALGYVPLNKHGDTMTGPLLLSRDPVSSDEAATRAFVLENAGNVETPIRGIRYVTDFNASGSYTRFTGAITSGTKILTLTTSAHDFQVGQGICILGAGAVPTSRGNVLVSLITAVFRSADYDSGQCYRYRDGSNWYNVQHDDTVAIQNAINAVLSDTTGGGTLIFPDGGTTGSTKDSLTSTQYSRFPMSTADCCGKDDLSSKASRRDVRPSLVQFHIPAPSSKTRLYQPPGGSDVLWSVFIKRYNANPTS